LFISQIIIIHVVWHGTVAKVVKEVNIEVRRQTDRQTDKYESTINVRTENRLVD